MSDGEGRGGGELKASGSSARSHRGQLSGQLASLAASLIGLDGGGGGQVWIRCGKVFKQSRT